MTSSILDSGKYRKKKDWNSSDLTSSSSSSCTTNFVTSTSTSTDKKRTSNISQSEIQQKNSTLPPKPPRRSSLATGIFTGRLNEKVNKRRSSIAVTFLGKRDNVNLSKDSSSTYESAVKSEKSDASSIQSQNNVYGSSRRIKNYDNNDINDRQNKTLQTLTSQQQQQQQQQCQSSTERIRSNSSSSSSPEYSSNGQNDKYLEKKHYKNSPDVLRLNRDKKRNSISFSISNKDENSLKYKINEDLAYHHNRQKRHSWWNMFVPDQLKTRSRRASQDVGIISRSVDSITISPIHRSKSKSVDHGVRTSVDLDLLQSKGQQIEQSEDNNSLGKETNLKQIYSPIIKTTTYTVGTRDTLTSVAARFDTTPSELTHLNRLSSSFIYPGQQLLVPDKSADIFEKSENEDKEGSSLSSDKSSTLVKNLNEEKAIIEEKEILEGLCPGSPKPGHIKRVSSNRNEFSDPSDDPITTQRFLKISVRHITDGQGVVGGVLLVTPNAVMFDPNVSDPLVIEHGPEHYGVIAPMELVVNAAIFYDIAHMRVAGGELSEEKVEIYYPKKINRHDENDNSLRKDKESDVDKNKEAKTDVTDDTNKKDRRQSQSDENKSNINEKCEEIDGKSKSGDSSTVEDRRKSLLDHHWAIPSKDRSFDEEGDLNVLKAASKVNSDQHQLSSELSGGSISSSSSTTQQINNNKSQLSKQVCHDSGIDICDSNTISTIQPIPTKKVYSDADIVLSSDWVPPRTISPTHTNENSPKNRGTIYSTGNTLMQTQSLDTNTAVVNRKKTSSVSFSVEDNEQNQNSQSSEKSIDQNKKNKMLKRLSYPLTWVEGLTGESTKPSNETESAPNTGDSNQSVFSKVFSSSPISLVSEIGGNLFLSKTPSEESGGSPVPPITSHSDTQANSFGRSSIATFMRPQSTDGTQYSSSTAKPSSSSTTKTSQPKLDYRSMVSVDDMPELFVSFDKLIPRPAQACQDPPLYLRLRMGKPVGRTIPLPTSVMSYGKNKLRPEYWFSIPKNRVDELHRFINTWVPHLYGELDEEAIKKRGYELIQHDTEWASESVSKEGRRNSDGEDITELTRESWELLKAPYVKIYNVIKTVGSHDLDFMGGEILSMSTDEYRKASLFASGSFDLDFPLPDLIGETEILTEDHREKLCGHLPARAEGYSWTLVFSTSQHGFSLNSLYRKMQKLESPILIVIEDTDHNIFGALTSCALHASDHFYGTGESLLFKFNPTFKVFHWTGENLYFIKGNPESLSIGAGDGKFGLWLDGDLNQGRTQSCSTYGNEPLAPQEDFVVKTLECWAFV